MLHHATVYGSIASARPSHKPRGGATAASLLRVGDTVQWRPRSTRPRWERRPRRDADSRVADAPSGCRPEPGRRRAALPGLRMAPAPSRASPGRIFLQPREAPDVRRQAGRRGSGAIAASSDDGDAKRVKRQKPVAATHIKRHDGVGRQDNLKSGIRSVHPLRFQRERTNRSAAKN